MSASFAPSPPSRTLGTALGHCMGLSWLMSSGGCPFYLNDLHTASTSCSFPALSSIREHGLEKEDTG